MPVQLEGVISELSHDHFHTPSSMARSLFYYMLCAGEFVCNGDYRVERNAKNAMNNYLLMYVREGRGTIVFRGRTHTAGPGDIVLLDCYAPHIYFSREGWRIQWIHFDGCSSRGFFELLYSRHGCVIPSSESKVVPRCLNTMLSRLQKWGKLPEANVSCDIQRMLVELLALSPGLPALGLGYTTAVGKAIEYIEDNYAARLTLHDIASYANLSIFHLSRLFKRETGYSPYEYVIKTRIDKAKEHLRVEGLTVKETCYTTGFTNESNFISTFQKLVGVTPGIFRIKAP